MKEREIRKRKIERKKGIIDTWPTEGLKREQWFMGAGRLKTVVGNN